ncbi:zinc-binding dehydrogenase [Halalkalibacillus halophilus]|uniref:zinc-binding dehydrogenase n=1 Tax=Halalkalibacillus halophilus TaxID=392827 RepID=UPI00041E69B8|nr:zinc-binding dehydrogenase [Halalkalibacillus halophilus]
MRAIVHEKKSGLEGLNYREIEEPNMEDYQVKVSIKYVGLNRRDLAVTTRHDPKDGPLIIGSDASGVIQEVGTKVQKWNVGDEVIIHPGTGWDENSDAPPEGFQITGFPDHGTFSDYMVVNENDLSKKPKHLSLEEASVLALAGLTAYRALFTRGSLKAEDTVMLPGIGSGVLTFMLKYAKSVGSRVVVTSRHQHKLEQAKELGADIAIATESDWNEELKNENVDLLIESVGKATFNKSLGIIRKGGTIVTFGATTEDIVEIDIRKFFYGQFNLLGSTMGSNEELAEMISFIETHNIKPELDRTYDASNFQDAINYFKDSDQFGKIAIKM